MSSCFWIIIKGQYLIKKKTRLISNNTNCVLFSITYPSSFNRKRNWISIDPTIASIEKYIRNIWLRNVNFRGLPILMMHMTINRDKMFPEKPAACSISSIILQLTVWLLAIILNLYSLSGPLASFFLGLCVLTFFPHQLCL